MVKKSLFIIFLASLMFGCSKSDIQSESQSQGIDLPGEYAILEQPSECVSVGTKSIRYDDGPKFYWSDGESIAVFDDMSTLAYHKMQGVVNENKAKFEPAGFSLIPEHPYYSFIPRSVGNGDEDTKQSVYVPFEGQRQTSNDNTDHLRKYAYATAQTVAGLIGDTPSCTFEYKNQVCWLRAQFTFSSAVTGLMSVSLTTSDNNAFATEGTMDVTQSGEQTVRITPISSSNQLSLLLGEKNGEGIDIASDGTLTVYFTMLPTDLTNKKVVITALDILGHEYTLGSFTPQAPFQRNIMYNYANCNK